MKVCDGVDFFHLVLKRHWKSMGNGFWKCVRTLRKCIIRCSCANVLDPAQAIPWNKCNLTRFWTNFKFEDFFWMVPRATCSARACSWLNQTTPLQSSFCTLRGLLCMQVSGYYIRFSSDFWVSNCKAVFALASFHNSYEPF